MYGSLLLLRHQGGKAVLTDNLQMWCYRLQPRLQYHQPPGLFFTWPLCLWMPYWMWSYKLICSSGQQLTSCGLDKTVGWYFLAAEYLEYQQCHKNGSGSGSLQDVPSYPQEPKCYTIN